MDEELTVRDWKDLIETATSILDYFESEDAREFLGDLVADSVPRSPGVHLDVWRASDGRMFFIRAEFDDFGNYTGQLENGLWA